MPLYKGTQANNLDSRKKPTASQSEPTTPRSELKRGTKSNALVLISAICLAILVLSGIGVFLLVGRGDSLGTGIESNVVADGRPRPAQKSDRVEGDLWGEDVQELFLMIRKSLRESEDAMINEVPLEGDFKKKRARIVVAKRIALSKPRLAPFTSAALMRCRVIESFESIFSTNFPSDLYLRTRAKKHNKLAILTSRNTLEQIEEKLRSNQIPDLDLVSKLNPIKDPTPPKMERFKEKVFNFISVYREVNSLLENSNSLDRRRIEELQNKLTGAFGSIPEVPLDCIYKPSSFLSTLSLRESLLSLKLIGLKRGVKESPMTSDELKDLDELEFRLDHPFEDY